MERIIRALRQAGLILALLISPIFGQADDDSEPLILGLWASIDGNLLESGLNNLVDVNNLGLKVLSGKFTLSQTGLAVQAILDGVYGSGISSPDGTLHIHVASAGDITANSVYDDLVVENSVNSGITIFGAFASEKGLTIGDSGDNDRHRLSAASNELPISAPNAGKFLIKVGATDVMTFLEPSITVNEGGVDQDFRIESDLLDSALVVDGATGLVHIEGELVVDGGVNYKVDTASDDDYLIAITSLGSDAIVAGTVVSFTAQTLNTGACTLKINSGLTISIKTQAGGDPVNSYIVASSFVMLGHNGTNWVLLTMDSNQ